MPSRGQDLPKNKNLKSLNNTLLAFDPSYDPEIGSK